jgi:hypothetical protein
MGSGTDNGIATEERRWWRREGEEKTEKTEDPFLTVGGDDCCYKR